MKTNKIVVFACGALLLFTACKKGGAFCYSPKGENITEVRALENFSKIELGMSADLYVSQGADYQVKIESSENIMGIIETKVSGNKLKIDLKNNKCLRGNSMVKVFVQLPSLNALSVSGSGQVYVLNQIHTSSLDIDISGSGDVTIDSLNAQYISENVSGSGRLYLKSTDTLIQQTINISGSGKIEAFGMPTLETKIKISGSGEGRIHVIDYMDAHISGSGNIFYMGHPTINQHISGSGKVTPY